MQGAQPTLVGNTLAWTQFHKKTILASVTHTIAFPTSHRCRTTAKHECIHIATMTDDEPRQLLPHAESHHNLSTKLGASRPLPPRNRTSKAATSLSKSPLITSQDEIFINDRDDANDRLGSSHDSQATAKSHDDQPADLEARRTASPEPMSVQRTVSGSSVRSMRSNGTASDIPKQEIEKALEGLDRDDLVIALGRAKVQMDHIEAQLEDQVSHNESLQESTAALSQQLAQSDAQVHSLQSLVKQREERIDEIMADQDRMEGEVYSTMQVIERLRKQLSETERSRNDAEKRYLDQTATMDKERQYYQDTEALLKSQKATQASAYDRLLSGHNELLREHERITNRLASIKASTGIQDSDSPLLSERHLTSDSSADPQVVPSHDDAGSDPGPDDAHGSIRSPQIRADTIGRRTFAPENDMTTLVDELSTLQKSHSSLTETMSTLQAELKDVRAENLALRDQNEAFMDILQEKTFSGALLNESAMLRGIRRASLGRLRAHDSLGDPYDQEDATEADSLDTDDTDDDGRSRSTSLSSSTIPEEDEDDVDDVPDTPRAPPNKTHTSRRRRATSGADLPATNLASELQDSAGEGVIAASSGDRLTREKRANTRIGSVSDSVDELQQEVRELREANQALTLYISKIIDRIIAREGYENILAVESRGTIRGPRHKPSRATLSLHSPDQKKGASGEDKTGSRNVSNASTTSTTSMSNQAGGMFSFGGPTSEPRTSAPPKSKRTSSIDWRSLPFLGGGSSSNAAESVSILRPLTLQSDNLLIPSRDGSARKLRSSEEIEDEHDVAERERIRKELLMRGIQPPKHQLVQSPTSPHTQRPQSLSAAPGAGGFAAFFSRVVGGASSNPPVLSPTRSDSQSQASTTPGRSSDTAFERAISSTPAARDEERSRAVQLSAGSGTSLTKISSGQGIASRARQQRAERHQQTLELAAESSSGYPFPSSLHSSASNSRATSGTSSLAESSILENSVAGDESYSLPAPPANSSHLDPDSIRMVSPLTGYGGTLPPLPHETTGDEDPQAFRSPTLAQDKPTPQSSQDQGWKRAFRRISLLNTNTGDANDPRSSTSPSAGELRSSPLPEPNSFNSSNSERSEE
ncbi:hypothetical protein PHSY_002554 [Pseudozyma hubeiensis SY62]|uniref:Uncharacterized protein n=1 Tax=Pseudozyma hubeiensis (strain SY62) TaxID=1305764 RepID=R9P185_PSEHS|nr:hypothetical protein PHSY_002554 [Pseudozyma hubeiensis SY62]GAC94981.1 hypothetical protein PHSY_002554 [Pseudozyma hubeiensis SY62]